MIVGAICIENCKSDADKGAESGGDFGKLTVFTPPKIVPCLFDLEIFKWQKI